MKLVEKAIAAVGDTNQSAFDFLRPTPANSSASAFSVISRVIDIILIVAGALAVIYLIYSGILYITAAGNPDSAKKGQQGIINAVIGIVIIVLAFIIFRAVANTAGTI